MFTQKDFYCLDSKYFNIILKSGYCVTLQSKNTAHYWHVISAEFNNHSYCRVLHNHHNTIEYHEHKHERDLESVIKMIYAHDQFQLSGRNKKRGGHR